MMNELNNDYKLKDGGFSNYENTLNLPRHRWYYYKEGFSPLLVEKAMEEVGICKGDVVIDPFNGSGTTTLTASLKGYKSYGIEVNPFTSFLSEAKAKSVEVSEIEKLKPKIFKSIDAGKHSDLMGFSTFSKTENLEKWLFNDSVLESFEGGWQHTDNISSYHTKKLARLALISAAMQNCNAKRDGKCLRYRQTWAQNKFDKYSFLESLENNLNIIQADIEGNPLKAKPTIINGDARKILDKENDIENFKLCITSPPYLNTFDYTDIYRPELFLGKFVNTNQQLYNLRLTTVRSHIQAKWDLPSLNDFGILYEQSITHLNNHKMQLMNKNIPLMVQAYFEDMHRILTSLKRKAVKDAQLWLVVSNSAYANTEIPVDLIIGDIGARAGWFLKEIGVLRHIKRRKTKHSPDVNQLRESVIIFTANK